MRIPFTLLALSPLLSAQEKVSYDDHILPLFEQACLNCHNPDKAKGGLDLSNFAGVMKGGSSGKIVEPGDVSSTLVKLVKQTAEPKMPPEGEKLSAAQIDLLTKWIEGGLLENKSSTARKPEKPKFETALRSDPGAKPEGPPPMPEHLLLEPPVVTERATAVHAIAASPWAPLLAVTAQRQILLHHTETLDLIGILPFPEGVPISLAFTPDARYLIVGGGVPGKSGFTVTFDVTTGARVVTAGKEFDSILAADIRPSFDIVATGGPSKLLNLWNTSTGERVHSVKKHTDWITALDISPDGILLASGDRTGGVWVWEAETANEFHTLRAHQAAITSLAFRADSNLLASASEDGSVRFWEMNNGNEVKKIDAHPGGVTAFAFTGNGSFVTAGRDNKAKLWKADFNSLREIKLPALPTAAAFDGEGKRAFVADSQGNIHAFSAGEKGSAEITTFPTNPPSIEARLKTIANRISESGAEEEIATLKAREKHWNAAAINTRAIHTAAETQSLSGRGEEDIEGFLQSLAELDSAVAALNRKRAQLADFERALESRGLSAIHREEAMATLASLVASVKNLSDLLREKETAITNIRRSADNTLSAFHKSKSEERRLRDAYQRALR
jgi:mono/diheme cytochrome c family protein